MSPFPRSRAQGLRSLVLATLASGFGLPTAAQANEEGDAEVRRAIEAARRDLSTLNLSLPAPAPPTPQAKDEALTLSKVRSQGQRGKSRVPRHASVGNTLPKPEWMRKLVLPDVPVHWDARLVSQLEYFRDDPRGRTMLAAWFKRAGRYERMIKEKLNAAKLPGDLLFIAMIESSFDPAARSDAGAVGMWQLVQSTGREYGLTINQWADQRLSPEHSTDAAIHFLSELHDRLGSWPMVFAAYNMGYSALLRSVRKYNTNNFWVLANMEAGLPYETIGYVAKATACAIAGSNPGAFGLTGLVKHAPADTALVRVSGGTSLGRVARAAGLSVSDLSKLNPELMRERLPPDVLEWEVRVPGSSLERFERRFRAYQPLTSTHRKHLLRLGERLEVVALSYDTTEARLRSLNGLGPRDVVVPGTVLVVPDVEARAVVRESRPTVGVPKEHFKSAGTQQVFYEVLKGDRLELLAEAFRVRVEDLARWNDLEPNAALVQGMFLQIFVPTGKDLSRIVVLQPADVDIVTVGTDAFYDRYEAQQNRKRIRYVVQEGDTLASLSQRFGLSVGSIARINRFSRYENPPPNTEIILYVPN